MNNVKVFTPKHVICSMMDACSYGSSLPSEYVLYRHVMDNSCGNGAILKEVVSAYVTAFYKRKHNCPWAQYVYMVDEFTKEQKDELRRELELFIHGIEIDSELHKQCIENLNKFVFEEYGLTDVKWDVICDDALTCHKYDGMMDYIFGNPPFQNVHDFGDKKDFYKSFDFVGKGMADLYIIFFEVGFRMLSECGRMAYITPSSWTTSLAGSKLRDYVIKNNLLEKVIDYKGERIFKDVTTFNMISVFNNWGRKLRYKDSVYILDFQTKESIVKPLHECVIDGKFYFTLDTKAFDLLKEIKTKKPKQYVRVKNGFATLNDKLFVVSGENVEKYELYPSLASDIRWCIKASKGERQVIVYPYNAYGEPKQFDELLEKTRNYLLARAEELGVDTSKENWWLYGRSQGIKDMPCFRVFVNNLVKTTDDIKSGVLEPYNGIYSGYYILPVDYSVTLPPFFGFLDNLKSEFVNYVKALGKYKNGGYYTFSSDDLEDYLNYKIEKNNETENSRGN